MSKKVKIILITLVVLVLSLGIVLGALGIWYHTTRRPYEMFEQVFGFELPETADILRWTIPKNKTWDIAAKISVQEEDLPYLETNLHVFMSQRGESEIDYLPRLSALTQWWDVNESDKLLYGWRFVTKGKTMLIDGVWMQHRSRWGYIFFMQDVDNESLLYVLY